MDDPLTKASDLLVVVNHLLDSIVEILESSESEALRAQAKLADQSWQTLTNVEEAIYAFRPNITPRWRSGDSSFAEETREYARLIIAAQEHWAAERFDAAVQLWREYLTREHSYLYEMLAKRSLASMEESAKQLAAPPTRRSTRRGPLRGPAARPPRALRPHSPIR